MAIPASLGAFLGGNQGQGGIVNPLVQLAQQQQQKQQQAIALAALRQAIAGGQSQGGMGVQPFNPSPAAQAVVPPPGANAPPQSIGRPGITPLPSAAPAQPMTPPAAGGRASMSPLQDPATKLPADSGQANIAQRQEQMMLKILDSNAPPEAKMKALEMVQAFVSPAEKMQAALDTKIAQLQQQRALAEDKIQEIRDIYAIRDQTQRRGQDMRAGTARAGQEARANKPQALANDPIYQGLKNDVSLAKARVIDPTVRGADHDQAMKDYQAANAKLAAYKPAKSASEPSAATPAAQAIPVPAEAEDKPDGTPMYDEQGNKYVKKGDQMVPEGQ